MGINALTRAYGNFFFSIWGVAKALMPSPGFGQPRKGLGPEGHRSWLGVTMPSPGFGKLLTEGTTLPGQAALNLEVAWPSCGAQALNGTIIRNERSAKARCPGTTSILVLLAHAGSWTDHPQHRHHAFAAFVHFGASSDLSGSLRIYGGSLLRIQ